MRLYQAMRSINGGPYEPAGDPTEYDTASSIAEDRRPGLLARTCDGYVETILVCDECGDPATVRRGLHDLCEWCANNESETEN